MLNAASAEAARQHALLNGGMAHVTIKSGKDLIGKNSSMFSSTKTSDPFVKVLSGGNREIARTKTMSKNLSPAWDETFSWEIGGKEQPCIVLAIFDDNTLTSDEPMGIVTISLTAVRNKQPNTHKITRARVGAYVRIRAHRYLIHSFTHL
jgi:Ca2+-dependent lipid-binding protein